MCQETNLFFPMRIKSVNKGFVTCVIKPLIEILIILIIFQINLSFKKSATNPLIITVSLLNMFQLNLRLDKCVIKPFINILSNGINLKPRKYVLIWLMKIRMFQNGLSPIKVKKYPYIILKNMILKLIIIIASDIKTFVNVLIIYINLPPILLAVWNPAKIVKMPLI